MTSVKRNLLQWGALVIGVLALASAAMAQETRGERAEIRFLEGMMDHHQMALDMANHCLTKAESEDLLTLCNDIIAAQSAEIEQMHTWLLEWYFVLYTPVSMATSNEAHSMEGMDMQGTDVPASDPTMMMGMMAGLNRFEGSAYETAWVESMIDHHDDALHMANRILERAEHDELRALAEKIIADQSAEIEQMEAMLAG